MSLPPTSARVRKAGRPCRQASLLAAQVRYRAWKLLIDRCGNRWRLTNPLQDSRARPGLQRRTQVSRCRERSTGMCTGQAELTWEPAERLEQSLACPQSQTCRQQRFSLMSSLHGTRPSCNIPMAELLASSSTMLLLLLARAAGRVGQSGSAECCSCCMKGPGASPAILQDALGRAGTVLSSRSASPCWSATLSNEKARTHQAMQAPGKRWAVSQRSLPCRALGHGLSSGLCAEEREREGKRQRGERESV